VWRSADDAGAAASAVTCTTERNNRGWSRSPLALSSAHARSLPNWAAEVGVVRSRTVWRTRWRTCVRSLGDSSPAILFPRSGLGPALKTSPRAVVPVQIDVPVKRNCRGSRCCRPTTRLGSSHEPASSRGPPWCMVFWRGAEGGGFYRRSLRSATMARRRIRQSRPRVVLIGLRDRVEARGNLEITEPPDAERRSWPGSRSTRGGSRLTRARRHCSNSKPAGGFGFCSTMRVRPGGRSSPRHPLGAALGYVRNDDNPV